MPVPFDTKCWACGVQTLNRCVDTKPHQSTAIHLRQLPPKTCLSPTPSSSLNHQACSAQASAAPDKRLEERPPTVEETAAGVLSLERPGKRKAWNKCSQRRSRWTSGARLLEEKDPASTRKTTWKPLCTPVGLTGRSLNSKFSTKSVGQAGKVLMACQPVCYCVG